MRIFLYEWATGGGLVDEPGGVPDSLLREGAAMVGALATDLARIDGCQVTVLRDVRMLDLALHGCEVIDVDSSHTRRAEFERLAVETDGIVLIAPEFDAILWRAARHVENLGGHLLSPSPEFIHLTADKQRTAERLTEAGLPVPQAVVLDPEQPLPKDFEYPAVLKPIDGAGSQDTQLVVGPYDEPLPYAWSRRLERFYPGMSTSVAALCGPSGKILLPVCRQRLSDEGRLRYLGGQVPVSAGLAKRASRLAARALDALPTPHGYVGVDLVLGPDPNGSDDYVIEVNPRLTTSYVGLRALAKANLAHAMLQVCAGQEPLLTFDDRPLEYDTDGHVSFAD